jgi:hypothetical protein
MKWNTLYKANQSDQQGLHFGLEVSMFAYMYDAGDLSTILSRNALFRDILPSSTI